MHLHIQVRPLTNSNHAAQSSHVCFRIEIFKNSTVAQQFVEKSLVVLKLKFLQEESRLKRAALIYMLCKICFTDEMANLLKLRITCDEWEEFKRFINDITDLPEYEVIKIIFYQLFAENFLNITMKNKRLALDYGSPVDNDIPVYGDQNEPFWQDIRSDIEILEKTDVAELKQLNEIRVAASQPFKNIFPEQNLLSEALKEFDAVKSLLQAPKEPQSPPPKLSRKDATKACRKYLNSAGAGSSRMFLEKEDSESGDDVETFSPKLRRPRKPLIVPQEAPELSSTSEGEEDFRRMKRSLGYESQNVMKGIGASDNISDKLKKVYERKS